MALRRAEATRVYLVLRNSSVQPYTGQAANITAYLSKDGAVPALLSGNPTELGSTNYPGVYYYDLTGTQMDADLVEISPKFSGTGTFMEDPVLIHTDLQWETNIFGAGFTALTDSLPGIANLFRNSVAPTLLRGTQVTEFSGTGWLSRVARKARQWADQPALAAKFTATRILELVQDSIRELFSDVLLHGTKQIGIRYQFTIVDGQYDYILPPGIGQVLMVGKWDTDQDYFEWEINPTTHWDPYGLGWTLEGNILHLRSTSGLVDEPIDVLYTPNGDIRPHTGTLTSVAADGTSAVLAATVTDGVRDTRANAYAGYMFRVLSATTNGEEQEREATSYNATTRTITFRRPLSPVPTGTIVYEVAPVYGYLFEDVLALHVARSMLASIGKKSQFEIVTQRFREKARALRMQLAKTQLRDASRFDTRGADNVEYTGGGIVI